MKDFFVSYSHLDQAWAEWIASTLEDAKYSTVIQAWDFPAGSNFAAEMQRAATECKRTIAVLSKEYLASVYTLSEWLVAFADDPTGQHRKLVPVRVQPCEIVGFLKPIVYCDLVGLDQTKAKDALINAVRTERRKPDEPSAFPGRQLADADKKAGLPSEELEKIRAVKKLLRILRTSYTTFLAQCRVRDELVERMHKRLSIEENLEYERFFHRYFALMDDEERQLHGIIRAYTENVMSEYNKRALDLLDQLPELVDQVELLSELHEHLAIWLGKYKGVLEKSPSVSLVYVGVEEGVPFPRGVEENLQSYLKTLATKGK